MKKYKSKKKGKERERSREHVDINEKERKVQRAKQMSRIKLNWEIVSADSQKNISMNITGFVNPSFSYHHWALPVTLPFEILIRSSAESFIYQFFGYVCF